MYKLTNEQIAVVRKLYPKKQTNIEKIRAMSVGEFVGMFGHNGLCYHIQYDFKSHCEAHGVCDECLWDFLESEVEE